MPLVTIQLIHGRDQEKIAKMISNVSKAISESLEEPIEKVRVAVHEVPTSHFGIAGNTVKKIREQSN
ncbi:2-hydroxymuconate tautomerase family protein [Alicyclobacillus dauci]|uniref:Tautomerase n=1 Tax=Alicyclobacillus dauci TaxID=1475485 RepID=A0ABY6Z490_9BACL|nr:2-hydroxymuconate tautomerase family protein [Alicyclobacillus dauci]WAH37131.1 2-hydroxymuconate tautomerase family protein [Alicyclobacillus dauci]